MIQIEGHWERVDNLYDIERIVREYYNSDLADELNSLIEIQDDKIERLERLTWQTSDEDILLDEIDDLEHEIRYLKRKIEKLETS